MSTDHAAADHIAAHTYHPTTNGPHPLVTPTATLNTATLIVHAVEDVQRQEQPTAAERSTFPTARNNPVIKSEKPIVLGYAATTLAILSAVTLHDRT
ncbi:hypothetical protein JCM11641_003242 [Rhodosporidiobolus odoratus]